MYTNRITRSFPICTFSAAFVYSHRIKSNWFYVGMKSSGTASQFTNVQHAGKWLTFSIYFSFTWVCFFSDAKREDGERVWWIGGVRYGGGSVVVMKLEFSCVGWHNGFVCLFIRVPHISKKGRRNEPRLKKFWRSPNPASSDESTGAESPTPLKGSKLQQLQLSPAYNKPTCSLPLLQVWPSQVS